MSVKLYFNNEIRRFPLESLTNGLTFGSLIQKIHQIYPNLIASSIKLYWKDQENDKIIFKTDDELKEVSRNCVDDVLRIFIEEDGEVEKVNAKMETDAVPTPNEIQTPTPPVSNIDPTLHVGVACDGCDGAVTGLRFKCLICYDFDLCNSCEAKHLHNQHPMIRIVSPQDDTWKKAFISNHIRAGHPKCHARRRMREAAESFASASASASSNSQPQPNLYAGAGVQFLRNVGEAVAAALNGFGIDVDIDVEHDGLRQKVSETTKPTEEKPVETPRPVVEPVEPIVVPTPEPVSVDVISKPDAVDSTAAGIRKMDINESVYPKLDKIDTSPTEPANQQGWTLLEKPDESKETMKAPTLVPINLTQVEPAKIIHHPNAHINNAVECMINMGFTNEGNWLTNLLIQKEGDISAVLDVLQPVKKF